MFHLSPETDDDFWEVEYLYDLCFAPGREALSSYRLRDDQASLPDLSRMARDELGVLAGAIRFWPIRIGPDLAPALLLGPIAVHPTRQGEGLAQALMTDGMNAAEDAGWQTIILIGDHSYYSRFGFERAEGIEFPPPTNPERILVRHVNPDVDKPIGQVQKWAALPK
ncbi:MAG: putative N-acetyltransferase YhbS [Paracoccaceae bacterium]